MKKSLVIKMIKNVNLDLTYGSICLDGTISHSGTRREDDKEPTVNKEYFSRLDTDCLIYSTENESRLLRSL